MPTEVKFREAEKAAEYLCPECIRKKQAGYESNIASPSSAPEKRANKTDYEPLWNIFHSLKNHRTSWPFQEAVDRKDHPNYYTVVKKPIGLFFKFIINVVSRNLFASV